MYQLSNFERTAFFTSSKTPANIVLNVTLLNAPTPRVLINAYKFLQKRHPLLSVKIQKKGMLIEFSPINPNQMIVALLPPKNNVDLKQFVEEELIRKIDIKNGSLYQLTYFFDEGLKQKSNLVLTFHHSIIDGIGVINIVDELLSNCASIQENKLIPCSNPRSLSPTSETRFMKGLGESCCVNDSLSIFIENIMSMRIFALAKCSRPIRYCSLTHTKLHIQPYIALFI